MTAAKSQGSETCELSRHKTLFKGRPEAGPRFKHGKKDGLKKIKYSSRGLFLLKNGRGVPPIFYNGQSQGTRLATPFCLLFLLSKKSY